ncbi:MAG: type VI secretion system-associated protein TagF [Oceanospirillaceae bacterium]|nr:type VI secretion system-associated protein TagF [Oceanospirillaceae bacterium]
MSAGFYGKLPGTGDFVNRRLPSQFVEPWDHWLQSGIATSQNQLEDNWLNLYLTSPIWRFVLSKGLTGEYPWAGLVMPSVDSVGRYFPLTIACQLPLDVNPMQIATRAETWFDMAEEVLVSALEDPRFNLETFDARVVSLGSLDKSTAAHGSATNIGFGSAWQLPLQGGAAIEAVPNLTHQLLLQRLSDYSVWWGRGSAQVSASLLVCAGLPINTDFAAMLDGNWSSGSWEQW